MRDVVASLSTVVLKLPNLFANCVGRMRFGNGGIAPLLMSKKLSLGGRLQDTKAGCSYNAGKLAPVDGEAGTKVQAELRLKRAVPSKIETPRIEVLGIITVHDKIKERSKRDCSISCRTMV